VSQAEPGPSFVLSQVDTARELTRNDDVVATTHLSLDRREANEGVGGKEVRPQIAVCAHLLT
jgi:hypothetical protein